MMKYLQDHSYTHTYTRHYRQESCVRNIMETVPSLNPNDCTSLPQRPHTQLSWSGAEQPCTATTHADATRSNYSDDFTPSPPHSAAQFQDSSVQVY